MANHTDAAVAVRDLLRNRRSHRAFSSKPIEHDKLMRLFEAARWAPSARNEQPWRFVLVSKANSRLFDDIIKTFPPFNFFWAKNAAALIVAIEHRNYEVDGSQNPFSAYDLGESVAYLTVQAEAEGLVSRQIGAFNSERVRDLLEAPGDYHPTTVLAVGYPGEASSLPDEYRSQETAPRRRKSLEEIVFEDNWGKPFVP